MNFLKVGVLNSFAVIFKMLCLLGVNKVLAYYVGPSGYAALGQFQNAVQVLATFAGASFSNGITKYTSQYSNEKSRREKFWRSASFSSVGLSAIFCIIVILYKAELAIIFLGEVKYSSIFLYFGASLIFFSINNFLLAVLSGLGEYKKFIAANIFGSFASFLLTVSLTYALGLYGALLSLATYQAFSLLGTLIVCFRCDWFTLDSFFGKVHLEDLKKLFGFSLMALATAITVPVSHMLIRDTLIRELSWAEAGYWEAMWRISSIYLLLVTSALSLYYLPRLSQVRSFKETRNIVSGVATVVIPLFLFVVCVAYFLRDWIVRLLFTEDFYPVGSLFLWQLIGDFIRVLSFLFAYIMLSRAMMAKYIFAELVNSLGFYFLVLLLVPTLGLQGAVIAHAINCLIYFLLVVLFVKKYISQPERIT